jgi:hypothetical protein
VHIGAYLSPGGITADVILERTGRKKYGKGKEKKGKYLGERKIEELLLKIRNKTPKKAKYKKVKLKREHLE